MRRVFWLKALGVSVFMTGFFAAYFYVLHHPVRPISQMPLTALDQWLDFEPMALWPYVSLWFYVGIPPMMKPSVRELGLYGVRIGALCITGLTFFYLWPTAVPPTTVERDKYQAFELLRGIDASGNACPSLHVATALFSAVWIDRLMQELGAGARARAVNWVWLLAIVYSTVATKQHVVLDVLAGLGLGALFVLRPRQGETGSVGS